MIRHNLKSADTKYVPIRILLVGIQLCALSSGWSQIPDGTMFRRVSRASNFEFALHNNGLLFGDWSYETGAGLFAPQVAHWPRGSAHLDAGNVAQGLMFLAKKDSRVLSSDAGFMRPATTAHGPFDSTVPGRIGDPKAGYDSLYGGKGWLYVDDRDYVVYSSLDYNSSGIDISGNNFNDWPIRLVEGERTYVADPLQRNAYPPVYGSDEDMFCVFKDTDSRADRDFAGPTGPETPNRNGPIGIEVECSLFSWGTGPARDIVVLQYDIVNKSGSSLDSCFIVFGPGIGYRSPYIGPFQGTLKHRFGVYLSEPGRNLSYLFPTDSSEWRDHWTATDVPPTLGFPLLETPKDQHGVALGLSRAMSWDTVDYFIDSSGETRPLAWVGTDSVIYHAMTNPPPWLHPDYDPTWEYLVGPLLISGPFWMLPDGRVRFSVAFIFSDSLSQLLLLDDFINRVYNNNFTRPSPPPASHLTATGLNRAVKLSWDNSAESATDIIIPDSLGRPFMGYRLLRATSKTGPFVEIGKWNIDSTLVYEFLDTGEDLSGGLKNNVTYYYQLLSFDEGAVRLKLDPMESPPVEGVNAVSVIPTTEPSNATSNESGGAVSSGILGDVTVPVLIPTNTTNFNRLLSGRELKVRLDATSNGVRYTLPVTITDSIAGRVHNAVIDPDLLVNGSTDIAGPRTGTATIQDIFGIGAADVTLTYSYEQLSEPFHIVPSIEGGSDCPIIIGDSSGVTGLQLSSPYTSASPTLILEFLPGGIDTISTIFQRYIPYLTVRLIDESTGEDYTGEWSLSATAVRRTGGVSTVPRHTDRYYLTGTLSNGEDWDCGHLLEVYNWGIVFDYPDHGIGSGKPAPTFSWSSQHAEGTVDFQAGDRLTLSWQGGVRAVFPEAAIITLTGAPAGRTDITEEMMEGIRIVPNPYFIRHEAQRTTPEIYFNYLPEECTIRIYTLALDLVKTITHTQGSREVWNLTTEGGQLVASQMFVAHIEASNGAKTIKKFAVVVGN